MPGTDWSDDEEAILVRRRATGASLINIAQELKRPLWGVRHKAARLNAGVRRNRRGFSRVDARRIRQLYPTATWAELERAFPGHTRDSIRTYAERRGLRRRGIDDAETEIALIDALTEQQAAYIAGLIDGEGSIIWNQRAGLRFSMGLTNEAAIRFLAETVGGGVHIAKVKEGRKPVWHWSLSKERACTALLKRLRPHMIIKREYPLSRPTA